MNGDPDLISAVIAVTLVGFGISEDVCSDVHFGFSGSSTEELNAKSEASIECEVGSFN